MTLVGAIRMAPQLSDRRVSCSVATGHLWTATGRIAEILNDFEIFVTLVRRDPRVRERHRHCSLTAGHHLDTNANRAKRVLGSRSCRTRSR
jgi:hypothetical protein